MNFNVIFIVFTLVFMLASFQSLSVYFYLKSQNYLKLSFILLFLGVDTLLIGYGLVDTVLELLPFIIYMYLIHSLMVTVHVREIILSRKLWLIFYTFVSLIIFFSFIIESSNEVLLFVRYHLTDIIILYIGVEVFVTYLKVEVKQNKKLAIGRAVWIFQGILAILIGTGRLITFSVAIFNYLIFQTPLTLVHPFIAGTSFFATLGYSLFALSMIFIVFYSPESLLITKHQLFSVARLYDIMETISNEKTKKPMIYGSLDHIKDYLESLKSSELGLKSDE